ncbi:hypothetical protein [Streptomyces sp. NPDC002564]|uniref:hypothetical protein n=1 Tax=Streptomyces sp. NPDC002564 TaxID=3364649 RepID=UPI0036891F0A
MESEEECRKGDSGLVPGGGSTKRVTIVRNCFGRPKHRSTTARSLLTGDDVSRLVTSSMPSR